MIKITKGNLLDANVEALVNTVNTVGVMGKGIALQFRKAFPENYQAYRKAFIDESLSIGEMHVFATNKFSPKFIINFPTKKHWRAKSRIEDIEQGLKNLIDVIKTYQIKSIAIPPLGCGNGGLDWADVRPLMEKYLSPLQEVEVQIFEPGGTPDAIKMRVNTPEPNLTPARAALIALFEVYLLPGYRLSMLEIQKLAYFLQNAGEPLKLKFEKNSYGPYAENLHHLLQKIDGHFINGYGDRTQKVLDQTVEIAPTALSKVNAFLASDPGSTLRRIDNVSRLIDGFEYPHGMELLSTVHWVSKELGESGDENKIISAVHSWSDRKRKNFPAREIVIALEQLKKEEWI